MEKEITIISFYDLFLYLDDIKDYIDSILYYHYENSNADLNEILMYLSSVDEIIEAIKEYLNENLHH